MAAAPAGEQAAPRTSHHRTRSSHMSERPPEAPPGEQAPPPPPPPLPPPIEPRPAAAAGPAPGTVRRLTRRTDNKMLAGVASGIAAYLGIEPWIVRIGFVILVPFGGFGALAYLIAWLLVPVEGSQQSLAGDVVRRPPSGWRGYLGVALILLAVAILASAFSKPGVIWAILLIAFGVFLFRQEAPPSPPPLRSRRCPRPPPRPSRSARHRPIPGRAGAPWPCLRTCPSGSRRHHRPTAPPPGAQRLRPRAAPGGGPSLARSPSPSP